MDSDEKELGQTSRNQLRQPASWLQLQDIRRGTGLDSSVVNSSLWQMHRDGQVKREGECRSYRYTLIDTTAITDSDPSVQYRQRPGGVNPMTNLFNQCLAGVRK